MARRSPSKAAARKGGRAAARSRKSPIGRKGKRKQKFIQKAIKRPGALTRAKKKGESTAAAARRLKRTGTPLQKKQANFFLNVLKPASRKGGKRKR